MLKITVGELMTCTFTEMKIWAYRQIALLSRCSRCNRKIEWEPWHTGSSDSGVPMPPCHCTVAHTSLSWQYGSVFQSPRMLTLPYISSFLPHGLIRRRKSKTPSIQTMPRPSNPKSFSHLASQVNDISTTCSRLNQIQHMSPWGFVGLAWVSTSINGSKTDWEYNLIHTKYKPAPMPDTHTMSELSQCWALLLYWHL